LAAATLPSLPPPPPSTHVSQGTLEAHSNGLRFISSKGERVDITYANIRHGIFQPCEGEHVVLIHFHLKHSIIIGKKKFKDVQARDRGSCVCVCVCVCVVRDGWWT
jgi:nucleosome binding factor SPN SPT16 subunit